MDDAGVYGKTRREHDELLRKVLQSFIENNLKINKR